MKLIEITCNKYVNMESCRLSSRYTCTKYHIYVNILM